MLPLLHGKEMSFTGKNRFEIVRNKIVTKSNSYNVQESATHYAESTECTGMNHRNT